MSLTLSLTDVIELLKEKGEILGEYPSFIIVGNVTVAIVQVINNKILLKGEYENKDKDNIKSPILIGNYLLFKDKRGLIMLNILTFEEIINTDIHPAKLAKINDSRFVSLKDNTLTIFEIRGKDILHINDIELDIKSDIINIYKIPSKNQLVLYTLYKLYLLELSQSTPVLIYTAKAEIRSSFLIPDDNTLVFFEETNLVVLNLKTKESKVKDTEFDEGYANGYKISNNLILASGMINDSDVGLQIWNIKDMKIMYQDDSPFINDGYRISDKVFLEARFEVIRLTKYNLAFKEEEDISEERKKEKKMRKKDESESVFELSQSDWGEEDFQHIFPIPMDKIRSKLLSHLLFESTEKRLSSNLIEIVKKFI